MTDSYDPATPTQPDTGLGFTVSRTHLFIALGGLTLLAFTLSLLAKRKTVPTDSTVLIGDNWQESIAHLASAWDYRYAGMENRMSEIERMLRTALGQPEPGIAVPTSNGAVPGIAATSTGAPEPVQPNGTHPPVGAEEPPPPGVAHTSQ